MYRHPFDYTRLHLIFVLFRWERTRAPMSCHARYLEANEQG